MIQIKVAVMEFIEGQKVIWIHDRKGSTVLRIRCNGQIKVNPECTNICAHSDINVEGDIEICIPAKKASRRQSRKAV